jgi:hypothetical protein
VANRGNLSCSHASGKPVRGLRTLVPMRRTCQPVSRDSRLAMAGASALAYADRLHRPTGGHRLLQAALQFGLEAIYYARRLGLPAGFGRRDRHYRQQTEPDDQPARNAQGTRHFVAGQ